MRGIMTAPSRPTYSAFRGLSLLARDTLPAVALAVKRASEADPTQTILIFDDATGQQIDLDLRGDDDEVLARLAAGNVMSESARVHRLRPGGQGKRAEPQGGTFEQQTAVNQHGASR